MKSSVVLGIVIGCLIVATSSNCKPTSAADRRSPIFGDLQIDGFREFVVLVDSRGRMDLVRGDRATHDIPGCTRDVGRPAEEVGEEEESGELVAFRFSRMPPGRYILWMRPDGAATVQLSIQLFRSPESVSTSCGRVGGEVPLEAHRWYRVDVMLGARTAADTCGFSLGEPILAQAPNTLRSLASFSVK